METKPKKNSKAGNVIVTIFALVFVVIIYNTLFSDSSDKYNISGAQISAEYFIDQKLNCPSTADYNWTYDQCKKLNDTTFTLVGTVDAQNAFGAKLRKSVTCKLIYLPKIGQMRIEDLIIE